MSKQDKAVARMLGTKSSNEPVVKVDWKKMKAVLIGLAIAIVILIIIFIKLKN